MRALWRPLGLVHFLALTFRVLQWDSKKHPKLFNINGLERFGRIDFGGPTWTMQMQKAFLWSVALVFHFAGALPWSVALILRLAKRQKC